MRSRRSREGTWAPLPVARLAAALLAPVAALAPLRGAAAQDTLHADRLAPVVSIGQPPVYRPYIGAFGGWDRRDRGGRGAARALVGVSRDLYHPMVGMLGAALEGYAGTVGNDADGGVRVLATTRMLRLGAGVDFSFADGTKSFILTFDDPIVRGGFFRTGSLVRLEYLPGRNHTLNLGISLPVFQPWAGKTRPVHRDVGPATRTPYRPHRRLGDDSVATATALATARRAAGAIGYLTMPLVDPERRHWRRRMRAIEARLREPDADYPNGHTLPIEVDVYHRSLLRAFSSAAGLDTARGRTVTDAACRALLEDVLLPYNAYYGRMRERQLLREYAARAAVTFAHLIDSAGVVAPARRDGVLATFDAVLRTIHEEAERLERRWGDSRNVWLPFDLALRPEEHDTQDEVDRLLERVAGVELERGSDVAYLPAEAFNRELRRSIRLTKDYHVLWIHDYKGTDPTGAPDPLGRLATLAYLEALTRAARAFDSTGTLPVFMIFLDGWYYERRHSRLWMSVLEDPLHRELRLAPRYRQVRDEIRAAQRELREAVAGSAGLRRQAARRGEGWLANAISVHVNVTNPGDPSFPGRKVLTHELQKFFSDDWLRDHRKIVLYDLTEDDPSRGAAFVTGEGVGLEYESSGWEDRTVLVRGPGALRFKQDARELLVSQGFRRDQIPAVFRPRPKPAGYRAMVHSLVRRGWTARVLVAQNGTGYADKHASALKAALYTLMPAGSRIVAPNPLWLSTAWASMLLGSALRGCDVLVIAPAPGNFPGPNFAQLSVGHDILAALIEAQQVWADQIAAAGGTIRIGVYQNAVGTRDFVGRLRELSAHLRRNPFVRDLFPFRAEFYQALERPDSLLARLALPTSMLDAPADSIRPRLHLKSQLLATEEALRSILKMPQWDTVAAAYLAGLAARDFADSVGTSRVLLPPPLSLEHLAPLARTLAAKGPEERRRVLLYLITGSHNQDDRSRTEDGEVICLIAGDASLTGLLDFVYLVASATWVESVEELNKLLPPPSWLERSLAWWGEPEL